MEDRKVRMSAAIGAFSLAGVVTACGPVMNELPEETKFVRPALSSSESRELVQILNFHRKDWLTHWATSPSSSGADAIVQISLPPELHTIIYYYSHPGDGGCSMFGSGREFEGHQAFTASICGRLDALLL